MMASPPLALEIMKAACLAVAGREAELRLAQARRIPNISLGPLYKLDNEDQIVGGAFSIPLPFFQAKVELDAQSAFQCVNKNLE